MPSPTAATPLDRDLVARRLADIRQRTLELVSALDWPTLRRQHLSILSPMVWDLGHIGNFEETWIGQRLGRAAPLEAGYQEMFDPVQNPRPTREGLPLPGREQLLGYLERVREQTLETLRRQDLEGDLVAAGFAFEMVAEHEEQHQETLLQAMQVLEDPPYRPAARRQPPAPRRLQPEMVHVPAGPFLMGRDGDDFAYDNERPRHRVELPGFLIDRHPVTNGQYLELIADGGYRRPDLWSDGGKRWLAEGRGIEAPRNWHREGDTWHVRTMDQVQPLPQHRPVTHVGYWEAEAFAAWAGKRLPTEAEWEKAALWDPTEERARRYPWGDQPPTPELANLDQLAFAPADVGSYPLGASAYGVEQLLGDVWEWTASDFQAYPGFRAFPYPEYSEIFFGDEYKVLRGGSWATRPAVARGSFRNWDYPIRRQIFAGFRCARDAE